MSCSLFSDDGNRCYRAIDVSHHSAPLERKGPTHHDHGSKKRKAPPSMLKNMPPIADFVVIIACVYQDK